MTAICFSYCARTLGLFSLKANMECVSRQREYVLMNKFLANSGATKNVEGTPMRGLWGFEISPFVAETLAEA